MRAALLVPLALAAAAGTARADAAADARDYDADARLFYRIVACAGDDPVDAKIAKVVAAHCKEMARELSVFQERFVEPGSAFFAKVRPAGLTTTVVYPFGGGDLASALVVYPDATEVTTVSLEHAGDPTRLGDLSPKQLKKYLGLFRSVMHGLLDHTDFESKKLKTIERGPIPGQLAFFITGAALLGYRPVHLRFFAVGDDGALDYYTAPEVDALAAKKAKRNSRSWVDTDWSVVYSNSELELQKVDDPARVVVHHHLAANLDDDHFASSGVRKHLEAKGKVAIIVKAASYLPWMRAFSAVSDYITSHLAWMVSDETGVTVENADKAGLVQETYGKYSGAALRASKHHQKAYIKRWKQQKYRKLGFRFGYRDTENNLHLVITHPKAVP